MLRARVPRALMLSSTRRRPPSRTLWQIRQQAVHHEQPLRLRKPFIRWKRALFALGVGYICITLYDELVLEPVAKALEEAAKSLPADLQPEADYTPLFIPFPGTTKELERRLYPPNDPDWVEMIKFAKDDKSRKQVLDSVSRTVQGTVAMSGTLGAKPLVTQTWLYFDFLRKMPPEYERSGLELSNGFIKWATRPVDADKVHRARSIFSPWPLMQGIWSFTSVVASEEYNKATRMIGLRKDISPPTMDQTFTQQQEMIKKAFSEAEKQGDASSKPKVLVNPRMAPDKAPIVQSPQSDSQKPQQQQQQTQQAAAASTTTPNEAPAEIPRALKIATAKMREMKRRKPPPVPKGCVIVGGWVEVSSATGTMIIEVSAPFNVKTKKFDVSNFRLYSRRVATRANVSPKKINNNK